MNDNRITQNDHERLELIKKLSHACSVGDRNTFGLQAVASPRLKTQKGFLAVTDYILGFVTSNGVIFKKFKIDKFNIQPTSYGAETVKLAETKELQDGSRKNLVLLWHWYPGNVETLQFALVDDNNHVLADSLNVKTGFFFVKGLQKNEFGEIIANIFYGKYDPAHLLGSFKTYDYGTYSFDSNKKDKFKHYVQNCYEAYYGILNGGNRNVQ